MHFLLVLFLIGCFVVFPGFRKIIGALISLVLVGFLIIYGPLFFIAFWSEISRPMRILVGCGGIFVVMLYSYTKEVRRRQDLNTVLPSREVADDELERFDFSKVEVNSWGWAEEVWENADESEFTYGLRAKTIAMANGNIEAAKSLFMKKMIILNAELDDATSSDHKVDKRYKFRSFMFNEGKVWTLIIISLLTLLIANTLWTHQVSGKKALSEFVNNIRNAVSAQDLTGTKKESAETVKVDMDIIRVLSEIMKPDTVGVLKENFDKRFKPPTRHLHGSIYQYEFGGCEVIVEYRNKSILSIELANLSEQCTFNAQSLHMSGVADKLTYKDLIENLYSWDAKPSCYSLCGNAADPSYGINGEMPRAYGFLQIEAESDYDIASAGAQQVHDYFYKKYPSYEMLGDDLGPIHPTEYNEIWIKNFKNVKLSRIKFGYQLRE